MSVSEVGVRWAKGHWQPKLCGRVGGTWSPQQGVSVRGRLDKSPNRVVEGSACHQGYQETPLGVMRVLVPTTLNKSFGRYGALVSITGNGGVEKVGPVPTVLTE